MAALIRARGYVDHVVPANGREFTLAELRAYVGGFIEIVRAPDDRTGDGMEWFVLNENGKGLGLPTNRIASIGYWLAGGDPLDVIVGDVLLVSLIELGEHHDLDDDE